MLWRSVNNNQNINYHKFSTTHDYHNSNTLSNHHNPSDHCRPM